MSDEFQSKPENSSTTPRPNPSVPQNEVIKEPNKPIKPEQLPFKVFITEHLFPSIKKALKSHSIELLSIELSKGERPIIGDECSIIEGEITSNRKFWICFLTEDISSKKTISLSEENHPPSTIESFLIDEKKISMTLMVSRLIQRLNGQKWLSSN